MILSTERVSANNLESFLFIGFMLIFAIAASWYVWVKGVYVGTVRGCPVLRRARAPGIEREMKKGKLLLDCVLIITSVVPPELPMELSLAVNASLVALSKYGAVHKEGTSYHSDSLIGSHFLHGAVQDPIRWSCRCLLL